MIILNLLVAVCATLLLSKHANAFRISSQVNLISKVFKIKGIGKHLAPLHFRVADAEPQSIKTTTGKLNINQPKGNKSLKKPSSYDEDDPTSTFRKLSFGIVPVAATLGFAIVPSQKLAFRAAGAAAGGIAGFLAKSSLDQYLEGLKTFPGYESIMKKAVAEEEEETDDKTLLNDSNFQPGFSKEVSSAIKTTLKAREDILTYTEEALEKIAYSKGVKEDELSLFFTSILAEAIFRETKGTSLDLLELSALVDFVKDIGFSKHEVGNAFGLAAIKVGKKLDFDERGFLADKFPIPLLLQSAKLFFLADKLIGNLEGFYGKRVSMMLNAFFLEESYQMVISQACNRLFSQCVQAVLASSASRISRTDVESLEKFLTTSSSLSDLRPSNMQALVMEAVQGKLDAELQPFAKVAAFQATLADYTVYTNAREVFGWNRREMTATMDSKILPIYEDIVREVLRQVFEQPDSAENFQDMFLTKANDLRINLSKARNIVTGVIQEYNEAYMDRVQKVYKASDESLSAVYKIMITHAIVLEAFEKVTKQLVDRSGIPMPSLPFSLQTRQLLFQHQREEKLRRKSRAESTLNDLFDLTDEQRQLVVQAVATPKIVSWVSQCIKENTLTDNARQAYEKMLQEYQISQELWQPTATDFYYQAVKKIAEERALPSIENMEYLSELKKFLMVSESSAHTVQQELFGEKYIKAVTEAMTPSGVIAEDYVSGLTRLRARLGLSDEDGRILAAVAARNRFSPMLEGLVDIWKSNTDMKYRADKEKKEREEAMNEANGKSTASSTSSATGAKLKNRLRKSRDPISSPDNVFGFMDVTAGSADAGDDADNSSGPGNFMRETMNMVDMVASNLAVHGVDLASSATQSLVNAYSMIPDGDLVGIYKYFLIGRLTESNPTLRQRYDAMEPILVKILGIAESSVQRVKESVAYTSFKSILHNVLLYKDNVEASDLQQFIRLKKALPLVSEENADLIYSDARRHALVDHATALFGKFLGDTVNERTGKKYSVDPVLQSAFAQLKNRPITPVDAKRFRNQVSGTGLTMREVGFTPTFLSLLFALEVQHAIESQAEEELSDLQDIYEIEPNAAVLIIEASVKRYLSQVVALALTAAKRYKEPEAVLKANEILRYVSFISESTKIAADGNLFRSSDVDRLVSFYLVEIDDRVNTIKEEIEQLQSAINNENSSNDAGNNEETKRQEQLENAEAQLAALTSIDRRAIADRFQSLIYLTKDFQPPQQGIPGLMGQLRSDTSDDNVEFDKARKKWSWD